MQARWTDGRSLLVLVLLPARNGVIVPPTILESCVCMIACFCCSPAGRVSMCDGWRKPSGIESKVSAYKDIISGRPVP
jgi:hypothetical protein